MPTDLRKLQVSQVRGGFRREGELLFKSCKDLLLLRPTSRDTIKLKQTFSKKDPHASSLPGLLKLLYHPLSITMYAKNEI